MKGVGGIRFIVILILGMMALGLLTWGIGKVYLELIGQSSRLKVDGTPMGQKAADGAAGKVLVLPEAKFWTCQAGVFQNEHNAQLAGAKLQALAINAEVLGANPWTVDVGLGHSVNDLKGMRQTLSEKGIPTVPKQIVLPERTFRVAGNGSQLIVELLTNVNMILRNGLTVEALTKEKQAWDALSGDRPPKELAALNQVYSQIRAKTNFEEQSTDGLSLYFEMQRVINKLSGK